MAAVMRPRLIQGPATSEAQWLTWLNRVNVPPWNWRDCFGPQERLVALAPHPDDEVLACGGLLAMHALAGGECLIVGITAGEASHAQSPIWTAHGLAKARASEREQGLVRLGLPNVEVLRLGFPDGSVSRYPQELQSMLAAILRPGDVVVTTWRLDGHPDHDAAGACAAAVCSDRGCRLVEAPVWMWHWATPGDDRVPWQRLRQVPLGPQVQRQKQQALQAHFSQLAPRGAELGPVLDDAIVSRSRRAGEYFFI